MGKISKVFLSVCCILPLIGLVAFAEEEKPSDVVAEPAVEDTTLHIDETYVPGYVYTRDLSNHVVVYSGSLGFNVPDEDGLNVGDVLVIYADDKYVVFDVTAVGQGTQSNRTIVVSRETIEQQTISSDYYSQLYEPINPMNFVSLIGEWIVGCFSTVAVVLTGFASDNEWVTLFLLVIPLSGLIFTFVKSLIARR